MWRGVYWAFAGLTALGIAAYLVVHFIFEPRGNPTERAELGGEQCLGSFCIADVSLLYGGMLVFALGCAAFLARMLALREEEAEDSRDWEWFGKRRDEDPARHEDE